MQPRTASGPGLVVLYRWRLHPGREDAFVEAWAVVTRALRAQGSLGSRLHRGDDGLWYAYAQWPDAATRAATHAFPGDDAAFAAMRDAVIERLPEVSLEPVADHLVAP
ncbi:MAG: antibiotic biosynthesis monooxygenase [Kofleriaceae bacterium]